MFNVFTYGSLMFDAVWSRVAQGSYERCEAILQGYERTGVRDEVFPVLVPSSPGSQVQGLVYLDVSEPDLVRLDEFEGDYYFRKTVKIFMLDRKVIPAEAYILKEEYYSLVSPNKWDPVYFSTTGIQHFIHRFMGNNKH